MLHTRQSERQTHRLYNKTEHEKISWYSFRFHIAHIVTNLLEMCLKDSLSCFGVLANQNIHNHF